MSGQVVQITINVTDGNAAEAVQQVVAQLQAIGPAGAAGGAEAAAGLDQVGSHALTSLDNVRLLRDDLGIFIPRAMEKAIASSSMLSGAIAGMGSGLLAMGAVDIFIHIGESIYNAYEKYVSLNAAQDAFHKAQLEMQEKDFINVHSIETAVDRLGQAKQQMVDMKDAAESFSNSGWADAIGGLLSGNAGQLGQGVSKIGVAHQMAEGSATSAAQAQEIALAQNGLFHEQMMAGIEAAHAGDSALKGQAKITAELQKQLDINKEKQAYTQVQESARGNIGASGTGNMERETADSAARAKARAEEIELQRQYTDQVIQMQNEATNASLEGNALRAAQEQQEIDAVTRKFQEGEISKQAEMAETAAVQQKFAMQAAKLQEELDTQTKHLSDEANQAGMKGMRLLSAQLQTQLDSINAAEKKAVGPGGTETSAQTTDFNSQRDSARQIFYQKGVEEQTAYEEKIQQSMNRSDDFELQGYARIAAESKKQLDAMATADAEYYGDIGQALDAYNSQAIQVEADADRQRQQLHQKTMQELTKEEQQTARELLPEWQQAMLAIEDQYADRLHQVQQDVKTHVMTEQEGATAVAAAWQLASVQMQKSEEDARNKIASGLQGMFEHPEKFFEDAAMKTGFQLMANEMLSVFKSSTPAGGILQYLFGMGPEMNTSTNPMDAMKSALGMGGHAAAAGAMNPGMMQFQQGSTTLLTGSQALMQAATALQSAAGSMGGGGIGGGGGMGFGGLGLGGSSSGSGGGSGASPFASGAAGLGASSPMPETMADPMAGSLSADGSFMSAQPGGAGMGAAMGIVGGGLMAATSIYSAYQDSNPVAGAVGGAMGGMEMGAALGSVIPGLGTVVGGAIGAIAGGIGGLLAGIFGDKGKSQAEGLDVNTIQPELSKDMQDFETGRSGYSTIASDLSNMLTSAKNSTTTWGSGARNYFNSNIQPEINAALLSIQKQEAAGRSAVTLSAGQYHSGGSIGGFGDLATSDTEGFIHAMRNEFVVQPMAAQAHGPLLNAINAGNVSYSSTVQPRMPASASGGGMTLTIQAMDSKSVAQWAKAGGGRALVSAMNQAQTQYSGVGR